MHLSLGRAAGSLMAFTYFAAAAPECAGNVYALVATQLASFSSVQSYCTSKYPLVPAKATKTAPPSTTTVTVTTQTTSTGSGVTVLVTAPGVTRTSVSTIFTTSASTETDTITRTATTGVVIFSTITSTSTSTITVVSTTTIAPAKKKRGHVREIAQMRRRAITTTLKASTSSINSQQSALSSLIAQGEAYVGAVCTCLETRATNTLTVTPTTTTTITQTKVVLTTPTSTITTTPTSIATGGTTSVIKTIITTSTETTLFVTTTSILTTTSLVSEFLTLTTTTTTSSTAIATPTEVIGFYMEAHSLDGSLVGTIDFEDASQAVAVYILSPSNNFARQDINNKGQLRANGYGDIYINGLANDDAPQPLQLLYNYEPIADDRALNCQIADPVARSGLLTCNVRLIGPVKFFLCQQSEKQYLYFGTLNTNAGSCFEVNLVGQP